MYDAIQTFSFLPGVMMLSEKLSSQLLSIPEFFSFGWSVFKNNLLTILYIVLSVELPARISLYLFNDYGWIIAIPIYLLMSMGIAYLVERDLLGKKAGIKEVYEKLRTLWVNGILAQLLSMLIIFGMSLLLIIPGVVWFIYYIFVLNVVVLRGKKWKGALDYSKSLVVGRWWTVFGYFIVFHLILVLFTLILIFAKQNLFILVTASAIGRVVGAYVDVLLVLLFLNLDYLRHTEKVSVK